MRQPDDEDGAEFEGPSKTRLKREMHELQELGAELLALPAARREAIAGGDERLIEALREHARMPTREARRRHLQYIGKLLRAIDIGPVQQSLAAFRAGDARVLREAEQWRERLLAGDAALSDWVKAHPACEVQPLRTLIRNARREAAADAASAAGTVKGRKGAARELLQVLREQLRRSGSGSAPGRGEGGGEGADA
jgi:ribosome-associated protein